MDVYWLSQFLFEEKRWVILLAVVIVLGFVCLAKSMLDGPGYFGMGVAVFLLTIAMGYIVVEWRSAYEERKLTHLVIEMVESNVPLYVDGQLFEKGTVDISKYNIEVTEDAVILTAKKVN